MLGLLAAASAWPLAGAAPAEATEPAGRVLARESAGGPNRTGTQPLAHLGFQVGFPHALAVYADVPITEKVAIGGHVGALGNITAGALRVTHGDHRSGGFLFGAVGYGSMDGATEAEVRAAEERPCSGGLVFCWPGPPTAESDGPFLHAGFGYRWPGGSFGRWSLELGVVTTDWMGTRVDNALAPAAALGYQFALQ